MPASRFVFITFFSLLISNVGAQYVTYHSDVKPIIEKNCKGCHRPGNIGPMPLTNYEEVSAYGEMIRYVVTSGLMPPWYADTSYRHFQNERVLTREEVQMINDWVDGGLKEGAMPYGLVISETVGVTVLPRDPDLVISMMQPFEQFGIYLDQYQAFVIPTGLQEDKWIEGIEFVPGNQMIVKHATMSVSNEGDFDSLDRWDPRYGYFSFGGIGSRAAEPFWYTWSPQQSWTFFEEGQAKFLPKHSELIFHLHYGPTGKPLTDQSEIRLWFADKKVEQRIETKALIGPENLTADSFYIPPDVKKIFHAQHVLKHPIRLLSLTPQANLLCRSWEVFAKIPGEREPVRLLRINDWNFNWKETYRLEEPLFLPAGTVIHAMALYDNTTNNLCNPSDKPVPFGLGSHLFSEMFYVYFEYITDDGP